MECDCLNAIYKGLLSMTRIIYLSLTDYFRVFSYNAACLLTDERTYQKTTAAFLLPTGAAAVLCAADRERQSDCSSVPPHY